MLELRLNNVKWDKYHNVLIPDEPCSKDIHLSKREARLLLKKTGVYFIRYTSDFDCTEETEFWYVVKDKKSSMEELSANTRSKIRRGSKSCFVKKVSAEFIACSGYEVYTKAFERYETELSPVSKEDYYNNIMSVKDDASYEFFAVFENQTNQMIAYSKNKIQDNVCNYGEIKFIPEFLRLYPSYVLFFEMNNYYLNERMCKFVVDGARSINHKTNIQDFLIDKFKFRKAYCKLNIYYSIKVTIAINIVYPFRRLLERIQSKTINKLKILIIHEEIRRSYNEYMPLSRK